VQPYGMINKYFELKALEEIGPYTYPNESWVSPNFLANIRSWVPVWMTGPSSSAAAVTAATAQVMSSQLFAATPPESSDGRRP